MIKETNSWYISIGDTAKMLGVHVKTIRRWEKKGLLRADYRTIGDHRRYNYEKIKSKLSEIVNRGRLEKDEKEKINTKDEEQEEKETEVKKVRSVVIYARVSSPKQKEDLERQIELLKGYIDKNEELLQVYKDIGSGMNDRRKGLQRLLKDCLKRPTRIDKVIITFGDRLARFGTNIIKEVLTIEGIELVEMHKKEDDTVKNL